MHQTQTSGMRIQRHNGITWLDVENPGKETLDRLKHQYHLHPLHIQESLQKVQHSQVERETQYLFFVLHVPVHMGKAGKIFIHQVGVFLGKNFLLTIRSGAAPAITRLFEACDRQSLGTENYFLQGSSYLLYVLIGAILDDISDMADDIVSQLDSIEGLVFDNLGSDAERIGKLRQKIVRLRRVIGPKRLILQDLADQIGSFAGPNMLRYYSNNVKAANRLWEVIEEARETVEIFKDADFTTSTEQTNKILAVLTIIFTLTIPTTVVGTLYGMNVPLPGGLATGAWAFWGKYTTLIVTVAGSALLALLMYLYFRRKKWF